MHLYGWLTDHLMHGSSYPLGGTSEIAYQTIPVIERYGGKVLVNAPVTKILMDASGRAIGKRRMNMNELSLCARKQTIWVLTRSDTN